VTFSLSSGEAGEQQHGRADEGEEDGQPQALLEFGADIVQAARTVELADHGRECLQHARQPDKDAHIDGCAQGQGGQVGGGQARHHGGVDDAVGDHGQLTDQQWPGQGGDAPGGMCRSAVERCARVLAMRRIRRLAGCCWIGRQRIR
jgi:hypothetical protein